MPTLREWQHGLAAAIASGCPQPTERMEVYVGGYRARVHEALAEVYEATHQVLGRALFLTLAHAYALACPSRDYNLSAAGRHLPTFLSQYAPTAHLPFLPDLARLEWQVCEAFHAQEQPPLEAASLTEQSLEAWADVRLLFQPSVSVVASAWPILDLWQARLQPRKTIDLEVAGRPQCVAVYRQGDRVQCEQLDVLQQVWLEGLLRGDSLGQVCERVAAAADGPMPPVGDWFAHWVRQGLVVRCEC
jgi:hypothetical protein